MNGNDLTLILINNTSQAGSFSVSQSENGMAWLQKSAVPTTHISFNWNDQDYGFAWQETQTGHIQASQYWPADLNKTNQVTLKKTSDGYTFANQVAGTPPGTLIINLDPSVVSHEFAAGIGMAGAPFILVSANPSDLLTFPTQPMYWVVFSYSQTTTNMTATVSTNPEQIIFPTGVTSMTAILNKDMTWTIITTPSEQQSA